MVYVALEWDHKVAHPPIHWLVVECSSLGEKFGGPQALPPRRDVAYFVNEETAQEDAQMFADYKNTMNSDDPSLVKHYSELLHQQANLHRHVPFAWDHDIFKGLIRWAVLEWGKPGREDMAYFLDPKIAQEDAKAFSILRDRRLYSSEEQIRELYAATQKATKKVAERSIHPVHS